ncbi:MAG: CoA-binding protein [Peptococcaceae bacterium BICA1-7]|nr:MAG: CoA-binding protein [Peptococcaceae bacterium BICA1-7]HBV96680.1 CoA-binding protein [Desulfotomaculum sp.]
MFKNPADSEIKSVLKRSKNIAVVGLSKNSERDSYRVAEYLIRQGYQVLPVNPSEDLILGQKVYKDLVSIPFRVDIVNVFRRSSHLPGVVEEALEIKPLCIWAQLGVIDEGAASAAVDQGVIMVMDLCIKVEHRRLLGETVS